MDKYLTNESYSNGQRELTEFLFFFCHQNSTLTSMPEYMLSWLGLTWRAARDLVGSRGNNAAVAVPETGLQ